MTPKSKPKKAKSRVKAGTSKGSAAERVRLFVEAYISNGNNGTKAAISAGYSEKGAATQASRMLKDAKISSIIAERQQELANKYRLTTESIVAQVASIAHADLRKLLDDKGNLLPPAQWPDDIAGAVSSLELVRQRSGEDGDGNPTYDAVSKLKLWSKTEALSLGARILGMIVDKSKVQHTFDPADMLSRARARAGK